LFQQRAKDRIAAQFAARKLVGKCSGAAIWLACPIDQRCVLGGQFKEPRFFDFIALSP
jgi:hypothetical protein